MVVAVAGHKVPLLSKVVVEPPDGEVVVLRNGHIGPKRKCVYPVAVGVTRESAATRSRCRQGHILRPQLLDVGIDTNWPAALPWIEGIQIVSCPSAGISQDSQPHVRARYEFGNCL